MMTSDDQESEKQREEGSGEGTEKTGGSKSTLCVSSGLCQSQKMVQSRRAPASFPIRLPRPGFLKSYHVYLKGSVEE